MYLILSLKGTHTSIQVYYLVNPQIHKIFLQLYSVKRVLGDPQKEMLN